MTSVSLEHLGSLEFVPGKIPPLDEHTRSVLAALIIDETVELPPSGRGNQIKYDKLSDEDFIELYRPIVDILQLDPNTDQPPFREHINRASKLGITPSAAPIYNRMSLSKVHTGLGFKAKFRFTDWSKRDFIKVGKQLAQLVGDRPTRDVIASASRGDYDQIRDFPTVDVIQLRFGRIAVFHELIGYPSCKGWEVEDHLDWTAAFYRQNPDQSLSASKLEHFSRIGRGPSKQPIIKLFGSIGKYKQRSQEEFKFIIRDEEDAKNVRLDELREEAAHDDSLLDIITSLPQSDHNRERLLQVGAQYKLGKSLIKADREVSLRHGATLKSPDAFIRWCMSYTTDDITVASVETYATVLGVFDDLWPMYRFQNVDLRLKD